MDDDRHRQILRLASTFFFKALETPKAGQRFRDYLDSRGLTMEMAREYGIGAAWGTPNTLVKTLGKKGVLDEELVICGLASLHKGILYDKFQDRLMFTICDTEGRPVAFSGRAMGDQQAKYINSAASSVFTKGDLLYNLHRVQANCAGRGVVLVEGYMDVLAMEKLGLSVSVASMGTSLTSTQAALIKRLFGGAYVMYDGDNSGQDAAAKAVGILEGVGAAAKVALLPAGKDPDDVAKAEGKEGLLKRLKASEEGFSFIVRRAAAKQLDFNPHNKLSVLIEAIPMILGCVDLVERDNRVRVLSEVLEVKEKVIRSELNNRRHEWKKR